ncbi:PAS domain S-box protein [Cystobacter fuscus]
MTGQEDDDIDHQAQQAGATDFLEKSQLTPTLLERSIRYGLQHTRTLEALRRSQESFRELIERLPDGVCVMHDTRLIYMNPTYVRLLGYSSQKELLGKTLLELGLKFLRPEDWLPLQADVQRSESTGEPIPPGSPAAGARGGRVPAELFHLPLMFDGQPSHVWVVRDLTERKQMEGRLLRADRMGSLGLLAAGVAHEINNPLAYTMANLDHLENRCCPGWACVPPGARRSRSWWRIPGSASPGCATSCGS